MDIILTSGQFLRKHDFAEIAIIFCWLFMTAFSKSWTKCWVFFFRIHLSVQTSTGKDTLWFLNLATLREHLPEQSLSCSIFEVTKKIYRLPERLAGEVTFWWFIGPWTLTVSHGNILEISTKEKCWFSMQTKRRLLWTLHKTSSGIVFCWCDVGYVKATRFSRQQSHWRPWLLTRLTSKMELGRRHSRRWIPRCCVDVNLSWESPHLGQPKWIGIGLLYYAVCLGRRIGARGYLRNLRPLELSCWLLSPITRDTHKVSQ